MAALLRANVSVCSAARCTNLLLRAVQSHRSSFSPAARLPDGSRTLLRSSSRPASLVAASGEQSGSQPASEAGPASSKPPQLGSLLRGLAQPLPRSLLASLGTFLCLWQWVGVPAVKAAPLAALVLAALLLPAAVRRAEQIDRLIVRRLCCTQSPAAVEAQLHHDSEMLLIHSELVAVWVAAAHVLVFVLLMTEPRLAAARAAALLAGAAEIYETAMALLGLLFYKTWRARRLFGAAEEVCCQAGAELRTSGRSSGGQQP